MSYTCEAVRLFKTDKACKVNPEVVTVLLDYIGIKTNFLLQALRCNLGIELMD
jgi:hypothetical protein